MNILDWAAVSIAKIVSSGSKLLGMGAGATWSGEIALRLRPTILSSLLLQSQQIVIIAGTNGKTTTAKMISTVLETQTKQSHRNQSGANLVNGVVASLVANTNIIGRLKAPVQILEVDEGALPHVLSELRAQSLELEKCQLVVVLLNLFRDQLDRYGEVDAIVAKWQKALMSLPKNVHLVVNADDPHLAYLGIQLPVKVSYIGLDNPDLFLPSMQHATDTIYCPKCATRLTFGGVYFSHLGKWACGRCGLTHPKVQVSVKDFDSPLEGVYNKYNTLAAAAVSQNLGVPDHQITEGLARVTPAFGRLEEVIYEGKKVKILLSKNPTGMNESIRTVLASKHQGPLLVVLNDQIPDGRDVSWIWDVDIEQLKGYQFPIFVAGDRRYDLGLRFKYAEVPVTQTVELLEKAIKLALEHVKTGEMLWILPTYSAMLEVRKVLTGKKIL